MESHKENQDIVGYCDSNLGSENDNYKSTTGYIFLLNCGAISWCSKLQKITATSTTEAEYIALYHAGCESFWIKNLMNEIGIRNNDPITILEDNEGAIGIAYNPISHSRSKQIPQKYHRRREMIENNDTVVSKCSSEHQSKCSSEHQLADQLTKICTRMKLNYFIKNTGLSQIASRAC